MPTPRNPKGASQGKAQSARATGSPRQQEAELSAKALPGPLDDRLSARLSKILVGLGRSYVAQGSTTPPVLLEIQRSIAETWRKSQPPYPRDQQSADLTTTLLDPAKLADLARRLTDPTLWQIFWPVLETTYENAPWETRSPLWFALMVGCSTYPRSPEPAFQWMPIRNPSPRVNRDENLAKAGGIPPAFQHEPTYYAKACSVVVNEADFTNERLTAVAGTVLSYNNQVSMPKEDVPFSHPFGVDFNFNLAPDPQYWNLLAITSLALDQVSVVDWFKTEDESQYATTEARQTRQLDVPGTMHVETEEGLIPDLFRPKPGDRAVLFGRWIVDAGHESFGTEIHPPLLTVRASYDLATRQTVAYVLGRPYLTSQVFSFDDDGKPLGLLEHFLRQITNNIKHDLAAGPYPPYLDQGVQLTAYPTIISGFPDSTSFPGLVGSDISDPLTMSFIVRAPQAGQAIFTGKQARVLLDYSLTVRTGVSVTMAYLGYGDVEVTVSVSGYSPPPPVGFEYNDRRIKVYYEDNEQPEDTDLPRRVAIDLKDLVDAKVKAIRDRTDGDLRCSLGPLQPWQNYYDYVAEQFMIFVRNGVKTHLAVSWPHAPDPTKNVDYMQRHVLVSDWPVGDPTHHQVALHVDDNQAFPISGSIVVAWEST